MNHKVKVQHSKRRATQNTAAVTAVTEAVVEDGYCSYLSYRSPAAEAGGSKPWDSSVFSVASETGYSEVVRNWVTASCSVTEAAAVTGGRSLGIQVLFKQLQYLMVQLVTGLPFLPRYRSAPEADAVTQLLKLLSV